jgi:hypothetical protein
MVARRLLFREAPSGMIIAHGCRGYVRQPRPRLVGRSNGLQNH